MKLIIGKKPIRNEWPNNNNNNNPRLIGILTIYIPSLLQIESLCCLLQKKFKNLLIQSKHWFKTNMVS